MLRILTTVVAAVALTCACWSAFGGVAVATEHECLICTPPRFEWFENNVRASEQAEPGVQVYWGQIHLESAQLGTEGIECVTQSLGSVWNAGRREEGRGFGQILTWQGAGHVPEGTHTKLSASCRPEVDRGFITDEADFASEANSSGEVEPGLRSASTPWNLELRCGVREEEYAPLLRVGVPASEFPPVGFQPCPEGPAEVLEANEITEHSKELTEKKGCYASIPAPAGCMRVTVVEPGVGLEVAYGGRVDAHLINGVHNGLSSSKLKIEGQRAGELQCEFPASCTATAVLTGSIRIIGYRSLALVQGK